MSESGVHAGELLLVVLAPNPNLGGKLGAAGSRWRRKDFEFGAKSRQRKKRGNEDIVCPCNSRKQRKLLLSFPANLTPSSRHPENLAPGKGTAKSKLRAEEVLSYKAGTFAFVA